MKKHGLAICCFALSLWARSGIAAQPGPDGTPDLPEAFGAARDLLPAGMTPQERKQALERAGLSEDDAWSALLGLSSIRGWFYRPASEEKLFSAALEGVRARLDPRSALHSAIKGAMAALEDAHSEFKDAGRQETRVRATAGSQASSGIFTGLKRRGRGWLISALYPGGPGEKAGLKEGDEITAVDGVSVVDMDEEEALRAWPPPEAGAVLSLSVRRGERVWRARVEIEEFRFSLTASRMLGDVGYLYLHNFGLPAAGQALGELERLRAAGMRGLILDLRHNPGGSEEALERIAAQFLPEGTPLLLEERAGGETILRIRGAGTLRALPLAVIVDRETASAAEAFAGAMQDHGRAKVLGERTFGKGTVQQTWGGFGGPALTLTVANWRTPSGRLIEGRGLEPDVLLRLSPEEGSAALERLHRLVFGLPVEMSSDPAVRAALRILK